MLRTSWQLIGGYYVSGYYHSVIAVKMIIPRLELVEMYADWHAWIYAQIMVASPICLLSSDMIFLSSTLFASIFSSYPFNSKLYMACCWPLCQRLYGRSPITQCCRAKGGLGCWVYMVYVVIAQCHHKVHTVWLFVISAPNASSFAIAYWFEFWSFLLDFIWFTEAWTDRKTVGKVKIGQN